MNKDSHIIERYLLGDDNSVAELYMALKDRLLLTAFRFCNNATESHDIVQDVFLKMLLIPVEKRGFYFGMLAGNIEGYLSVIIKNKSIDTRKVNSNREKIIQSIRFIFRKEENNHAEARFISDGLGQMLNELQPREQQIIRLHLDGYKNEEIASMLNISYNSVKNNIYESKKKLRMIWDVFMK